MHMILPSRQHYAGCFAGRCSTRSRSPLERENATDFFQALAPRYQHVILDIPSIGWIARLRPHGRTVRCGRAGVRSRRAANGKPRSRHCCGCGCRRENRRVVLNKRSYPVPEWAYRISLNVRDEYQTISRDASAPGLDCVVRSGRSVCRQFRNWNSPEPCILPLSSSEQLGLYYLASTIGILISRNSKCAGFHRRITVKAPTFQRRQLSQFNGSALIQHAGLSILITVLLAFFAAMAPVLQDWQITSQCSSPALLPPRCWGLRNFAAGS